jgi:hypothetical protein
MRCCIIGLEPSDPGNQGFLNPTDCFLELSIGRFEESWESSGPVHATTLTVALEFGALVVSTIGWPGLRPDPSGGSAE